MSGAYYVSTGQIEHKRIRSWIWKINGDNLKELKYIKERIKENMKERENERGTQEILYCDPLLSVKMDCSNA